MEDIVWFSIILQIVAFGSLKYKWPNSVFNVLCTLQILIPPVVIVVASSWKRAFKFAGLTTAVIPVVTTLIILLVSFLGLIMKPNINRFVSDIFMSIKIGFLTWAVMLCAIFPLLVVASLARHFWLKK